VVLGRLRSALRSYALIEDDPAAVLTFLDRRVRMELGGAHAGGMFLPVAGYSQRFGGLATAYDNIRRTNMPTARDIMTNDVTCVGEQETVLEAAKKMAELGVGSLPICGDDQRLKGMLTDRDIVVKVLAQGLDPATTRAGELAQGKAVTVGADDDAAEILQTMGGHQVRRLPVIDGHTLVGIVAVADVARALPDRPVGDLIDAISAG
jgi:CBS domain-containing protein